MNPPDDDGRPLHWFVSRLADDNRRPEPSNRQYYTCGKWFVELSDDRAAVVDNRRPLDSRTEPVARVGGFEVPLVEGFRARCRCSIEWHWRSGRWVRLAREQWLDRIPPSTFGK